MCVISIGQLKQKSTSGIHISKSGETVYNSIIRDRDILTLFFDLQASINNTTINISAGHPMFIQFKNLGYKAVEI